MGDFDLWLRNQKPSIPEPMLPDGVWDRDGRYYANCVACEKETEVEELANFEQRWHYCGGSPRCCP